MARDDSLALGDDPTVKHAIGFVYEHWPELMPAVAPAAEAAAGRQDAGAPSAQVTATGPATAAGGEDATAGDPVESRVLEIVSEQTGYPPDMLDLDLDMEADLGIDTVKQAETFAALRDA